MDLEYDWASQKIDQGLSAERAMSEVDLSGLNEREKRMKELCLYGKLLRAQRSKDQYSQEIAKVRSVSVDDLPLEAGAPEAVRRAAALMKLISEGRNGRGFPFPCRMLARLFVGCPTEPLEGLEIIKRLREGGHIKRTRKGSAHGEGNGKASWYKWLGLSKQDDGFDL